VHDEAAHNLVALGYLVLEVYAGVGDGGRELGDSPNCVVAVGFLDGKQWGAADVVGAIISSTASRSPLIRASMKRLANAMFSSACDDTAASSFLPTYALAIG
jgi:hypothetical protein